MSLTTNKITELAPDQASLNAAHKLMKPGKWPTLAQHGDLVWGECQGSGANPYRTVFDRSNAGYKCTCPSRKFPCKHVLAVEIILPPVFLAWLAKHERALAAGKLT